jgi:hypothetical protein
LDFAFEQITFVVENFFNSKSLAFCQQASQDAFPNEPVLNKTTVNRLTRKLLETGCAESEMRLYALGAYRRDASRR